MSTNLLTAGRLALISRLQQISVANGYRTNLGCNVRSGWYNEVVEDAKVSYPLIVVQKAKGQPPKPGPGARKLYCGFNVIAGVSAGFDSYEAVLEDAELDLLQALMPTEGVPLKWLPRGIPNISIGAPESFPPGNGTNGATVLIPVYLHTIIEGY